MLWDYFVFVFIAAAGVFQIAAIPARLRGLSFFERSIAGYIFGALAIIGAFGWFFSSQDRNVPHRVEGAQQLGLFLLAIVSSYIVTLILSSLIQARVGSEGDTPRQGKQHQQGVETLKTKTLFGGIASSLRKERKDSE